MRNLIKPILSISALGVFLMMAFASEFLDESTNTDIQAEHCKPMPVVTGQLTITVSYDDEDGDPLNGEAGTFFINHQLIADTSTCQYSNYYSTIYFHLDANGKAQYITPGFSHDNESDLFRVEVNIPGDNEFFDGFRSIQVATYNETTLSFYKKDPEHL